MKAPSRHMPAAPPGTGRWWAFGILGLLIVAYLYWLFRQPYQAGILSTVLALLVWVQMAWHKRSLRRLAASRHDESICEFARSFERKTDTWLIRSVYEELSRYLAVEGRPIPVRRYDHCEKDLGIDPEDLDDMALDAAFRAGRSMEDSDKNPLYGKVQTVDDIVRFLEYQPHIVQPKPSSNGTASKDNSNAHGERPSVN